MSTEAMEVRDAAAGYAPQADQDVPPRYKRTEIGVIPEDWDVKRLADIAYVDPENLPASTNPQYSFNYISLEQVEKGRLLGYAEIKFDEAPSRARRILREGDVLLATVRPNLKANFLYMGWPPNAVCSTGFAVIRVNPDFADPAYIFAHLFAVPITQQIEKIISGSNYPAINSGDVRALDIPCPPTVKEQRTIATALSDVDALITALDKLIAKKRAIKTAAMQQLLTGKIRLPGFSGKWETRRLGELADVVSGGTPKSSVPDYWDGGIFWCTPTDITRTQGKYIYVTERTISKDGLSACSAQLLPPGSILLCTRATIGEMKLSTVPIATNQGFKSLVCKKGVSNEFMYYRLLMEKGRFIEKASGSTFLEISKKDVVDLSIRVPEVEEQTAIAQVLSDMDAEIAALEARRDKTRAIKKGMMQQLLAGKVRLLLLKKSLY